MPPQIAVLGAGYAGTAAIRSLEKELETADLVWISEEDHHFVLHEAHRCIRDPSVRDKLTIPIDEIKSDETRFVRGTVTGLDVDEREIFVDSEDGDGDTIDYDYVIVAIGSQTAFFDIDGLEEHALTLKSLDDALSIHERVTNAAQEATEDTPAQIVIGGAGLTGIQTAGEIAAWRDETSSPIEIHLVEMEDHIFPGHDSEFQGALRKKLEMADVTIHTGETCTTVDETTMQFEDREMDYDVLVWAGGVTGQGALSDTDVETDHSRADASPTFETSNDRVYAIGDAALVEQDIEETVLNERAIWQRIVNPDTENVPPPTAEAAMEEGKQIGETIARVLHGTEPVDWAYVDKGTLVSVGDEVVAHGVIGIPINTFSGPAARTLKKAISARWITTVSSPKRALTAWSDL